jgi:hypothetical protein
MDQQVGFEWSSEAGTRKRSTEKGFLQSTNVEEQQKEIGRSQWRFCAEHQGWGTGAPRKEPRKVLLCGALGQEGQINTKRRDQHIIGARKIHKRSKWSKQRGDKVPTSNEGL